MKALKDIAASRRQSQTPAPVKEIPAAWQPVAEMVAATTTLSARIPQDRALAYEARIVEAKRYIPKLTRQSALEALLELIQHDDIFFRWLDEVKAQSDK